MFPNPFELSSLDGTNGFQINGIDPGDGSGRSVSDAGDVNGDGIDDLIIGAPGADPDSKGGAGESYVVFGSDQGFANSLELADLDGANGFTMNGIDALDNSGSSVSSAGDINGDGFDDLIIGAPEANVSGPNFAAAGASYVVFGSDQGFANSVELADLDGNNGFKINGIDAVDISGRSVSGAGDVNGDGFDDIIIGAPRAYGSGAYDSQAGESYVVFGSDQDFPASFELSSLDGTNGFLIAGADHFYGFGHSVSGAGDINGDRIDDVIIGAPGAASGFVVFGSDQGFASSIDIAALDGNNGLRINGFPYNYTGSAVSGAGDVNGDGISDVIIGGPRFLDNSVAGQSYVVFGSDQGFAPSFDLSDLDGANGFAINGINARDESGTSVSGAGDVNRDGFDDVLIGAPFADPNGVGTAGQSYVVFGTDQGFAASLDLSSLNSLNGFQIEGINALDKSGYSVSGAGDVNGDGIDDLLVGAYYANHTGYYGAAGATYVIFGQAGSVPPAIQPFPELVEHQAVDPALINGVDPALLVGEGSEIVVEFVSNISDQQNSFGCYTIDETGAFQNVTLLDDNLSDTAPGTMFSLGVISEGEDYGFFLVKDGFGRSALIQDEGLGLNGSLSLVDSVTGAPGTTGGNNPLLLDYDDNGGSELIHRPIFLAASYDGAGNPLNFGGEIQSLSGLNEDGNLQFGFEDVTRGGDGKFGTSDSDFNDAVFAILDLSPPENGLDGDII